MACKITVQNYIITLNYHLQSLKISIEPFQATNTQLNYRLYQATYTCQTMPQKVKELLSSSSSSILYWFKYIEFHQMKCLSLNLDTIRNDQHDPSNEQSECELPLSFHFAVFNGIQLEGLEQPKIVPIKLFGKKFIFSKELIFKKLLDDQRKKNSQILNQLGEKEQTIRILNEKNMNLSLKIEQLQQQNQRLRQQQLPRKKIHISNEPLNTYFNQQISRNSYNVDEEVSASSSKKLENGLKTFEIVDQQQRDQLDKRILRQFDLSNHYEESKKNSFISQNSQKKSNHLDNEMIFTTIERKQLNQKANQETIQPNELIAKMLRQFAKQNCYLDVGYDEKGTKKYGYCCPYCQKVFKESDYLSKHFQTKHSTEFANDSNIRQQLSQQLQNFKRRKEAKQHAAENSQERQRKQNKMNEAMNKLIVK